MILRNQSTNAKGDEPRASIQVLLLKRSMVETSPALLDAEIIKIMDTINFFIAPIPPR